MANTKERDFSIGLDNHGFRYFDPEAGRYISRDPIGYASGSMNVYAYVHNNPINFIDPLGLSGAAATASAPASYIPPDLEVTTNLNPPTTPLHVTHGAHDPDGGSVSRSSPVPEDDEEARKELTTRYQQSRGGAEWWLHSRRKMREIELWRRGLIEQKAREDRDILQAAQRALRLHRERESKYLEEQRRFLASLDFDDDSQEAQEERLRLFREWMKQYEEQEAELEDAPTPALGGDGGGSGGDDRDRAGLRVIKGHGLYSIWSHPQLRNLWRKALQNKLSSRLENAVIKYMKTLERGETPSAELSRAAFNQVRGKFVDMVKLDPTLSGVPTDNIHHHNWPLAEHSEYALDPRLLYPASSSKHKSVHRAMSSGHPTRSPIRQEFIERPPPMPVPTR